MARKNTRQAVEAFINGKHFRARGRNGSPIWTMGGILYSYSQPIAKWSDADGSTAIVNCEKFSVTTSCQQGGVKSLLAQRGYTLVLCSTSDLFNSTERA